MPKHAGTLSLQLFPHFSTLWKCIWVSICCCCWFFWETFWQLVPYKICSNSSWNKCTICSRSVCVVFLFCFQTLINHIKKISMRNLRGMRARAWEKSRVRGRWGDRLAAPRYINALSTCLICQTDSREQPAESREQLSGEHVSALRSRQC